MGSPILQCPDRANRRWDDTQVTLNPKKKTTQDRTCLSLGYSGWCPLEWQTQPPREVNNPVYTEIFLKWRDSARCAHFKSLISTGQERGYGDTLKITVHTCIHKEYKGNGPYRLLKMRITWASTYSQPYIHKNPSYRPILTQNPPYPANPTNKTHISTPKTYPISSKSLWNWGRMLVEQGEMVRRKGT